ncbi:MAG: DUF5131 family protein [Pirellulales bacterium]
MKNSAIEWTHHTFNPWIGCTQVSPACDHCYAMTMMDHRFHRVEWGVGKARVRTSADYWRQPLRWHRAAQAAKVRERVFCASLADVFDGEAPEVLNVWRAELWQLIARTPQLDWLLLTKRPGNVLRMSPWGSSWPAHVWIGTSVENKFWAGRRLPILSQIPAAVRFVSAEPLLEDFPLSGYGVDWLIAGGESGHQCRPFDPQHVRNLRDEYEPRNRFLFQAMGWTNAQASGARVRWAPLERATDTPADGGNS